MVVKFAQLSFAGPVRTENEADSRNTSGVYVLSPGLFGPRVWLLSFSSVNDTNAVGYRTNAPLHAQNRVGFVMSADRLRIDIFRSAVRLFILLSGAGRRISHGIITQFFFVLFVPQTRRARNNTAGFPFSANYAMFRIKFIAVICVRRYRRDPSVTFCRIDSGNQQPRRAISTPPMTCCRPFPAVTPGKVTVNSRIKRWKRKETKEKKNPITGWVVVISSSETLVTERRF